jgi:hypothetical protein
MKDKDYQSGNIVMWENELWVVAGWHWPTCELISCNSSNVTAHPSTSWPTKRVFISCGSGYNKENECGDCCNGCDRAHIREKYDPKKGIGSVKFVAETLLEYIEKSTKKQFVGLEMGRGW